MRELKFTTSLLSAYYIASILAFFLFQLTDRLVLQINTWILSFLSQAINLNVRGPGPLWFSLFLLTLFITFLIRRLVVEPLGLYVKEEGKTMWERWLLAFLVFGFHVYLINKVFIGTPMPYDWWPEWFIRLLGGYENTFVEKYIQSIEERNVWTIVPWLWHLGPITLLYMRGVLNKKKSD